MHRGAIEDPRVVGAGHEDRPGLADAIEHPAAGTTPDPLRGEQPGPLRLPCRDQRPRLLEPVGHEVGLRPHPAGVHGEERLHVVVAEVAAQELAA